MQNSPRDGAAREDRPNYPIGSVDNALRLLGLFSQHSVLRLSEISDELGVGRSTAHRLVAMLQYHSYVEQDPETKAYRFGPALVELGLAALRELNIAAHVRPYLEQILREVDETVQLSVRFGGYALIVDAVEPDRPVRVGGRIGLKLPAHACAPGKAMLAILPGERLEQIYPDKRLPPSTSKTIATRAALERELKLVRERGYAIDLGEAEEDVAGVAGSIRNESGTIRASLGIVAPVSRMTTERLEHASDVVLRVCTATSESFE